MSFLKNVWYVGGFTHELDAGPVARKICNRDIVIYRGESGAIAALDDRCPHRFVPLSAGKVEGENIRCPYHGLVFAPDGSCAERPHDDGPMQPGLCVKSYVAADKHACIWLWFGEPAKANPDEIPDFSFQSQTDKYDVNFIKLHMKCNHQLVTDNILDLSHVHYLHPAIRPEVGFEKFENWTETHGNTVWSMLRKPNYVPGAFQRGLWGSDSPAADGKGDTRWVAPSYMLAHTALNEVGQNPDEGCVLYNSHLVTPETETTCHYFYVGVRNRRRDDPALHKLLTETVEEIFRTQDGPMLEAQQRAMGEVTDFLTLRPIILKADAAGIQARRMFKKMLKAEQDSEVAIAAE